MVSWLRLIGCIVALGTLLAPSVHAQDTFTSRDAFWTEIDRLDRRIADLAAAVAPGEQRSARAIAAAVAMRAEAHAAVDAVLAAAQAVTDRLAQGDLALEEKQAYSLLTARLPDIGRRTSAALREEHDAIEAERTLKGQLGATRTRRTLVLARNRLAIEPVHLDRVRLTTVDPRDGKQTELYAAEWLGERDSDEDVLALLTEELAALDASVATLEANFAEAERAFINASDRWQNRNDAYTFEVAYVAPLTNALLEVADVGVSVVMAGPGWPAALVYEALYRSSETFLSDVESRLPTLPEEIIAARERLSQPGLAPLSVPDLSILSPNPDGSFGAALADQETGEVIKNLVELAYSGFPEFMAQWITPYARGRIAAGDKPKWAKMALLRWLERGRTAEGIYERLGGSTRAEGTRLSELLARATGVDRVDHFFSYLNQPSFWKDFGKGFAAGLVVTAAKEGVKQLNRSEAERMFQELAIVELEWFVRRRALQTISYMLEFHRKARDAFVLAMAPLLESRDAAAAGRRLAAASGRIVLGEKQWAGGLTLDLYYSGKLIRSSIALGDDRRRLATGSGDHHWLTLGPDLRPLVDGTETMRVGTDADGPWDPHDGFDANPATVPLLLLQEHSWQYREDGDDTQHRLSFAHPELTLKDPDATLSEGDTIELFFRSTSTAVDGAWIGLVDPDAPMEAPAGTDSTAYAHGADPVPVPVDPNGAEGTVRLNTFLPGSYEVRLYDRREGGIAVASLPVCIADRDAEISACPDIAGHWLLQWSYGGPSLRGEIAVANQGGIDETYDYYAPSLEEDLNGPAWTCQRFGRTLACKVRFDPDSRCPNQGPHLANIEMTVDPSGQRLDGDYVITVSNDTSACAWVPLETAMQFSFEMVRDPAYQ